MIRSSRRDDRQALAQLGIGHARLRPKDWLHEAWVSVSRHAGRSLMTAIGTVLGAAAFVATLGIGSTMGQQVSDSFDARRATEVRVIPVDQTLEGSWQSEDRIERLRRLNGVTAAGRRLSLGEQPVKRVLSATGRSTQLTGADPGALAVIGPRLVLGRSFDDFHEKRKVPVIMLASSVAEQLGVTRVGVAVFIGDRPFAVVGIFDDVTRRPEVLLAAVVPASVAESLADPRTPPERDVLISVTPGAAQLIGAQAPYALRPESPTALRAIAPVDPKTLRREIEGNVTRSSLILSIAALIIGAISIANSATASIAVRVPELGLRRAIGARPWHIFAQLIGETTAVGALGGVVGVLVGITTIAGVALTNAWTPVLDLRLALLATAASAAMGLVAGLVPAARAMRIQPVAALQR